MNRYLMCAALSIVLSTCAFAVEPYQVGTYIGKFNYTATNFDAQKPVKEKANAVFVLAADGSAVFSISPGPAFPGEAVTGDYHGFFGYTEGDNALGSAPLKFANDSVSGSLQVGARTMGSGASIVGKFKLKKADMMVPMSTPAQ